MVPPPSTPSTRPMRPVVRTPFEEEILPVFRPEEAAPDRAPAPAPSSSSHYHWIELRYLHSDNTPVQGASYHVRSASGSFSFDGTLDRDGFVRLSGVPSSGGSGEFTYWFDKDPQPYQPRGPALASASSEPVKTALSALDSAGHWLWGALQGDFNKDQSLSQIGINLLVGAIPLVDQSLDLRDLVAGTTDALAFYSHDEKEQQHKPGMFGLSHETWLWLNLFLIGLGCIPGVGSVVKGVFKGLIRFLQDTLGKSGARLSPAQQKRLWEKLLRILNYLGLKPGNAHRFLKQMLGQLSGWMDQAAVTIKAALSAIGAMIRKAEEAVRRLGYVPLGSAKSRELLAVLRTRRAALARVYGRMEQMKWQLNHWLWDQLRCAVGGGASGSNGGKHAFEAAGSLNTPAGKQSGGANVRKQEQEPPPEVLRMSASEGAGTGPQRPPVYQMSSITSRGSGVTSAKGVEIIDSRGAPLG